MSDCRYENISDEEYLLEYQWLDGIVQEFCTKSGLYNYRDVQCNLNSVHDIIVRVHKRKFYFKVFHNGMVTSEYKDTALYCYWIIKLRPFWISPDIEFAESFNERLALYLYMMLLKKYDENFSAEDGLNQAHAEELLYSFRFRDLSKEAMILMLEPYYYAHLKKIDDSL